ncbi:MAG: hypothetical protein ACRC6I_01840, partial [Paracoccaceae bacterium]
LSDDQILEHCRVLQGMGDDADYATAGAMLMAVQRRADARNETPLKVAMRHRASWFAIADRAVIVVSVAFAFLIFILNL